MSLEAELWRTLLPGVPELVAALLAHVERPRMLPIKEAPIAYRLILDAEKAGELTVFRVGHASFVDEAELFSYIKRAGVSCKPLAEPVGDDIDALIHSGDERRARKAGK